MDVKALGILCATAIAVTLAGAATAAAGPGARSAFRMEASRRGNSRSSSLAAWAAARWWVSSPRPRKALRR